MFLNNPKIKKEVLESIVDRLNVPEKSLCPIIWHLTVVCFDIQKSIDNLKIFCEDHTNFDKQYEYMLSRNFSGSFYQLLNMHYM